MGAAYSVESYQDVEEPIRHQDDKRNRRPSFFIEDRIPVFLDVDLARELSTLLKDYHDNPALYALGRQLTKLVG